MAVASKESLQRRNKNERKDKGAVRQSGRNQMKTTSPSAR